MLYAVLWGTKTFVVAPPTAANLELMRRWQMNGEAADDETFPHDLEGARVVAVSRGQVWNRRRTHTSHITNTLICTLNLVAELAHTLSLFHARTITNCTTHK